MEKRFLATEVRASRVGNKRTIAGYAARYGVLSGELRTSDGSAFRERIASGAFKRILSTNPDVVALFNHNNDFILGRTSSGTLRLSENSRGLQFEVDVPDSELGRSTYESVQRGDLNGCSFAFVVNDANDCTYREEEFDPEFDEDNEGVRGRAKRAVRAIVRTIKNFAQLVDISIVTWPAYPGTNADARHLLVGAEVRSRVEEMKKSFATLETIRERMAGKSFEDHIEEAREQTSLRKRRLSILDL